MSQASTSLELQQVLVVVMMVIPLVLLQINLVLPEPSGGGQREAPSTSSRRRWQVSFEEPVLLEDAQVRVQNTVTPLSPGAVTPWNVALRRWRRNPWLCLHHRPLQACCQQGEQENQHRRLQKRKRPHLLDFLFLLPNPFLLSAACKFNYPEGKRSAAAAAAAAAANQTAC